MIVFTDDLEEAPRTVVEPAQQGDAGRTGGTGRRGGGGGRRKRRRRRGKKNGVGKATGAGAPMYTSKGGQRDFSFQKGQVGHFAGFCGRHGPHLMSGAGDSLQYPQWTLSTDESVGRRTVVLM